MRRFVILAHEASLDPGFPLDDLPGAGGRMDVLCRAVGAAFFLSHDLRRDVEVTLLLRDQVRIRFDGGRLKRLNPDERSTAGLIRRALSQLGDEERESSPGIRVSRAALEETLDHLHLQGAHPLLLDEGGSPFRAASLPSDPAFILSDHMSFTEGDRSVLDALPALSLGTRSLHTSQCITIVHYLLDSLAEIQDGDLVSCHKVWGEPKAQLIVGLLEDFGIRANLLRHASPSHLPVTMDGLAEVRIMVLERDLRRAREIIADYFEEPVDE
ncbi:MAG: tRNA (pseudouridine(54)-N(1))-methyltransferase TrmY [Candidatus Bipolaricaulota bacterium]|nr:MAG: tRNA (pseudouridine(54)-N(1))-methyltransferase TrmY [Candidatus Bipolaricaulota bacterium]